jgi:hypothetical protein
MSPTIVHNDLRRHDVPGWLPREGRVDVGQVKADARERAVGTRNRVLSHLAAVGEVTDLGGMASTALARAIGYPGSSVAFAQLLSAMDRSGLIERDIRGKRTYRIAAARTAASPRGGVWPGGPAGWNSPGEGCRPPGATEPASPPASARGRVASVAALGDGQGLDYDELARRLLAQVLRGAAALSAGGHPVFPAVAAEPEPVAAVSRDREAAVEAAVVRLERKLADARAGQRRLAEENARLREQIRTAEQSLAAARERVSRARPAELDSPVAALLAGHLLTPRRETADSRQEADAG